MFGLEASAAVLSGQEDLIQARDFPDNTTREVPNKSTSFRHGVGRFLPLLSSKSRPRQTLRMQDQLLAEAAVVRSLL